MPLNRIDLEDLPSLAFEDKRLLPNKAAVYFVIRDDGEVLYIGAAIRLKQRWEAHLQARAAQPLGATKVAWMLVPQAVVGVIEKQMIQHYLPPLNKRLLPRKQPTPPHAGPSTDARGKL